MKKIPFTAYKIVNMLLVLIPFIICWFFYYESRTIASHSKQVSALIILSFFFISYYFYQKLDCFRVSILQIRDIIFGQIIAVSISDGIMYILIWMLSIHLPNIIPGSITWVVQCIIAAIWSVFMHKAYFATHKPLKTIVIYDERTGMENLIHTYGLEKRFDIRKVYAVEDIINDLMKINGMEAVFLCGIRSSQRNIILKYCTYKGIKLLMIPRISDVILRGSEQIHMLHMPILKHERYAPSTEYLVFKRISDVFLSGIALVVLSPVFALTAIAVKADGGPAFYKQKRLTKNGKIFEILKFRSMNVDAEKYCGAVLSSGENDPRITKVGRIIRACRLDELPQLINILKGDMSIVGPRPERPEIQANIEKTVPEFGLRLQTKAGLTGYAQVYGKYNTTFYDKLLMDLMYISNPSILEDLTIILATIKILTNKDSTEGISSNSDIKYRGKYVSKKNFASE
ncbi:sugar transferase [Clostridiaceae bacterium HFYG-1003]|nr:sugar transferase [Clostridiaceae bacterium HFYG-1003]